MERMNNLFFYALFVLLSNASPEARKKMVDTELWGECEVSFESKLMEWRWCGAVRSSGWESDSGVHRLRKSLHPFG